MHSSQVLELAPAAAVAAHPVLIAAGIVAAADDLLRWLAAYAEAGGHLVVGVRTGYEDAEARARLERKPALLDSAAGVWYDEIHTLPEPVLVWAPEGSPLSLPAGAGGVLWLDGLIPNRSADDGAGAPEVLARYDHPHFSRFPAVTTRAHGAGRVTVLGTVPNPALAASVARWLVDRTAAATPPETPSVTVTGATAADGSRLRFVHNWSWTPAEYLLPVAARDVLSGGQLAAGSALDLGSWDVRVLVEES